MFFDVAEAFFLPLLAAPWEEVSARLFRRNQHYQRDKTGKGLFTDCANQSGSQIGKLFQFATWLSMDQW